MTDIPQSTTFVVVFKAYLASDHVTEATGKTIAITISKNAGAFGNPNAGATNATEISSGWYSVSLNATDTGTLGPLAIRGAVATIDDVGIINHVVATANLTAAQIATGVWQDATAGDFTAANSVGKSVMNGVALGTGLTVNDITTKTGYSLSGTQTFNNTGTWTGNIVGTLSTLTTYTGNTVQTGDAYTRLGAPAGASVSADIAAVNAKTTNLPASPAAVGSAMTLTSGERTSIADAMLDESNGVETGVTVRQHYRITLSAMAGKADGAATTTMHFRDQADSKNRITATVDSNGNRTAVTLDAS